MELDFRKMLSRLSDMEFVGICWNSVLGGCGRRDEAGWRGGGDGRRGVGRVGLMEWAVGVDAAAGDLGVKRVGRKWVREEQWGRGHGG